MALQKVPDANVTWTEGGMLKHKHSDVGVAVSIPGGLITPVVRHADDEVALGHLQRDEGSRARARGHASSSPQEYQGGTTAVSNLGMFGIKDFYRRDQPAARHDPRGRRGRGEGDRAQGQDRGRAR